MEAEGKTAWLQAQMGVLDMKCQERITELLQHSSYHHCVCNWPRELPGVLCIGQLGFNVCHVKNASDLVEENSAHSQQSNKENKIISAQRLWLTSWKGFIFPAKNSVGIFSPLHGLN